MTAVVVKRDESPLYRLGLLELLGLLVRVFGKRLEGLIAKHAGEYFDGGGYGVVVALFGLALLFCTGNLDIVDIKGEGKEIDDRQIGLLHHIEPTAFVLLVVLVDAPKMLVHHRLSDALVIKVEGGVDNIAVFVDVNRPVEHIVELLTHIFAKIGGFTLVVKIGAGNVGALIVVVFPVTLE